MKRVIHALLAALISVLIVLAAYLCLFVDVLTRTTAQLPITLDVAIAREGKLTRQAAVTEIQDTRKALVGQMKGIRQDVKDMETDLADRADKQISSGLDKINVQLSTLNTTISTEAGKITTPAAALFPPIQNTLVRVSDTSDLALDCDHNPDCAFNRYVGTARAIEKTSVSMQKMADTIQQVTPDTAAAVKSTSKDLSTIVSRFARPVGLLKGAAGQAINWAGKFLGF